MQEIRLNSARNCFKYLIRAFNIKEIYIPYYLCGCMRHTAFEEGCKVKFYHIDLKFYPTQVFPIDAFILYPNYFGICSKNVTKLGTQYKNLIVDNAHSLYSKPCGIASFNSIRKFFPQLRDGGILHTSSLYNLKLDKVEYEYELKSLNYLEICENENRIDALDLKLMSDYTSKMYNTLEHEKIKTERLNKFKKLNNNYKDKNLLQIDLKNNEIPFCYPFLAKDEYVASDLVKRLEKDGFLIYRYWENLPNNFPEKIFQKQLVPIPLT